MEKDQKERKIHLNLKYIYIWSINIYIMNDENWINSTLWFLFEKCLNNLWRVYFI